MRLLLLFAVALLICLAIQTTVSLWLPISSLVPNLVVILAVDLGMRHHGVLPATIAFGIGYAVDFFSGTHVGINALLMTLVYLLTYEVSSHLMMTNVMVEAVAVFLGALAAGASQVGTGFVAGTSGNFQTVAAALLLQAAVSAALAPLVFSMLAKLKRVIGLRAKLERE